MIIDGKAIAAQIREEVKEKVRDLTSKTGKNIGLAVVLVGENPASQVYVGQKEKACAEVGITSFKVSLPADISQDLLVKKIEELNEDPNVHGILVQLPLPEHLNESAIIEKIKPEKDVDGFHPINIGRLVAGEETFVPCTPQGIIELIERTGFKIEGAEAVVVGRSNIVGKPVALLLLQKHATVTICHTRTRDLGEVTRRADILVVAAGRPRLVKADMVKEGACVIDVGINRVEGKLVGDVDFEEVEKKASVTPVPGGVGPMTVTMLLKNTVFAFEKSLEG